MFENLSAKQLARAAQIKERIEALESDLQQIIGPSSAVSHSTKSADKGGMSAAGRARIVAAQRTRWAKFRKASGANGSQAGKVSPGQGRCRMSPAARDKIAAVARERWKKAKAAGKSSL